MMRQRRIDTKVPFHITGGLPVGSIVKCVDNSGCTELKIIGVKKTQGRRGKIPSACLGKMITAVVVKGRNNLVGKIVHAVIIRQKKPWRRLDGTIICCEDNAAIIVRADGSTRKNIEVEGHIPKECIDLWPGLYRVLYNTV
jgi:ribosomal protein L14